MSNLTTNFSSIISQAAKLPSTGLAANYERRLIPTGTDRVILLDISGSMSERVGETRRVDILKDAIANLDWQTYRLICFSNEVVEIPTPESIPEPNGSTALDRAFQYLQRYQLAQTLVISDGEPDRPENALAIAANLSGTISTLFVGDDNNKEAIAFMHKLGQLGCGRSFVKSLDSSKLAQQALQQTIQQALLPAK